MSGKLGTGAVQSVDALSKAQSSVGSDATPVYALDIVKLSKRFKRRTMGRGGYTTVKSSLTGIFSAKKRPRSVVTHAVRDLTVRVPLGSSIGIIGKNGSGKSTLLKLITGIYKADQGTISINGKIAALIELGAGFHPDFTGRENVFLGGTLHGLSRSEIEKKLPAITKFAELEDVIDDPVRTYSSGMFMRLGFSLAIHTDPDILIIDEVLAVGDAAFVNKCKGRIADMRREGKTLLLVTHDLDAVLRWCDEALWLHEGEARDRGDPRRVIDSYRNFIEKGEEIELHEEAAVQVEQKPGEETQTAELRWGSREIEITGVRLIDGQGENRLLFHSEDDLIVELDYLAHEPVAEAVFGIAINRSDGVTVHGTNTDIEGVVFPDLGRCGTVQYSIKRLGLLDGTYNLDAAVHRQDGYAYDYHKGIARFVVRWPLKQIGICVPEHSWSIRVNGKEMRGCGCKEDD